MAGFTVSALTDYTNKATELLRAGVLFSDAITQFSIQPGVKYKEPLNIITASPALQAGACSLAASGSTVLTEKVITVATMAFTDSYCIEDLQKKNLPLVAGSANDAFATEFESVLTDEITESIKSQVEDIIFDGTVAGGDLINGIDYVLDNNTHLHVSAVYSGVTVTTSNVIAIVSDMISKVSEGMWARGPLTLHTTVAIFNMYKQALIASKSAYQSVTNIGILEADVEGWAGQVSIKGEPGMSSNDMFLTWNKNIYIGTDEVSEISSAKYVFDEITELVWYKSKFKLGVQIAFPLEVVSNK